MHSLIVDPKDSGSAVSPWLLVQSLTVTALSEDSLVEQTERDLPFVLLGDNPAGQVVIKTGAQGIHEKHYGAPETQHQRHLLQGQPHCSQSSPPGH